MPPAAVQAANPRRILAWEAAQLRAHGQRPGSAWCGSCRATANARYGLLFPTAAGGALLVA